MHIFCLSFHKWQADMTAVARVSCKLLCTTIGARGTPPSWMLCLAAQSPLHPLAKPLHTASSSCLVGCVQETTNRRGKAQWACCVRSGNVTHWMTSTVNCSVFFETTLLERWWKFQHWNAGVPATKHGSREDFWLTSTQRRIPAKEGDEQLVPWCCNTTSIAQQPQRWRISIFLLSRARQL